jgi:hypothetical protein
MIIAGCPAFARGHDKRQLIRHWRGNGCRRDSLPNRGKIIRDGCDFFATVMFCPCSKGFYASLTIPARVIHTMN